MESIPETLKQLTDMLSGKNQKKLKTVELKTPKYEAKMFQDTAQQFSHHCVFCLLITMTMFFFISKLFIMQVLPHNIKENEKILDPNVDHP